MIRQSETAVSLRVLGAWATLVLFGLGAALAALEFVVSREGATPAEDVALFPALFGFLSFTAIVLGGAALRRLLARREDYYDRG